MGRPKFTEFLWCFTAALLLLTGVVRSQQHTRSKSKSRSDLSQQFVKVRDHELQNDFPDDLRPSKSHSKEGKKSLDTRKPPFDWDSLGGTSSSTRYRNSTRKYISRTYSRHKTTADGEDSDERSQEVPFERVHHSTHQTGAILNGTGSVTRVEEGAYRRTFPAGGVETLVNQSVSTYEASEKGDGFRQRGSSGHTWSRAGEFGGQRGSSQGSHTSTLERHHNRHSSASESGQAATDHSRTYTHYSRRRYGERTHSSSSSSSDVEGSAGSSSDALGSASSSRDYSEQYSGRDRYSAKDADETSHSRGHGSSSESSGSFQTSERRVSGFASSRIDSESGGIDESTSTHSPRTHYSRRKYSNRRYGSHGSASAGESPSEDRLSYERRTSGSHSTRSESAGGSFGRYSTEESVPTPETSGSRQTYEISGSRSREGDIRGRTTEDSHSHRHTLRPETGGGYSYERRTYGRNWTPGRGEASGSSTTEQIDTDRYTPAPEAGSVDTGSYSSERRTYWGSRSRGSYDGDSTQGSSERRTPAPETGGSVHSYSYERKSDGGSIFRGRGSDDDRSIDSSAGRHTTEESTYRRYTPAPETDDGSINQYSYERRTYGSRGRDSFTDSSTGEESQTQEPEIRGGSRTRYTSWRKYGSRTSGEGSRVHDRWQTSTEEPRTFHVDHRYRRPEGGTYNRTSNITRITTTFRGGFGNDTGTYDTTVRRYFNRTTGGREQDVDEDDDDFSVNTYTTYEETAEDKGHPFSRYGSWQRRNGTEHYQYTYTPGHPLHGVVSGGYAQGAPHACDESSCYPATGNLLIGREDKLWSSSTCGMHKVERFCIVSHLTERKKCFNCASSPTDKVDNPKLYHGIENIVSRIGRKNKTWWQSENGAEKVSIRLDLEAEFHFTHLIITFKTFRPAALLIERSHDFGRTWRVYQYFAYDCAEYFPGVPIGPRRRITDVVCDSQYSGVEPSTAGEVIFRVLPPNIRIEDPYSEEVQNLLKMTNLRINFTRLHTLGDNLLDSREEIKEKYYYAINDMVVRGSCSCYGHASRCIAVDDQQSRPDMVYGNCNCTHNTQGWNCEKCQDFYNDQPWKPAIGRQTNACKVCNCHEHSDRCHFDPAVWEATGRISGGVCNECQHNTMGRNCEQCKPFFYQDPGRDLRDPNICQPCDCDPTGSQDEGICDSTTDPLVGLEAGHCHCKRNVEGRRCDRCKNGFWKFEVENPDGCIACSCHTQGTVHNQGCNVFSGECVCKRNVIGRDCNQCLPEYWGLSIEEEGCKPCECDPGGSYDNNCDVVTGQCRCRPNINGRRCDLPVSDFFIGNLDYMVYEAELANGCNDCQVLVREPHVDRVPTWSGLGFMRVFEGSRLEFDITDIPTSMEYDIVIRYEPQVLIDYGGKVYQLPGQWEEARVTVERPGPVDSSGPCANSIPQDDIKIVSLQSGERYIVAYPPACFEKGKRYKIRIVFKQYDSLVDTPSASILIDSIALVPRTDSIPFFKGTIANEYRRQEFERLRCGQAYYTVQRPVPHEVCKKYLYSIGFYVYGQANECYCDPTGAVSTVCVSLGGQCNCKPQVVGRRCDRCAPGTYGFGPTGCKPCDCNSVGSLDNFCDAQTGQCKCRTNTYGRQCDECQPGFWNYPNCQRCDCNGHADTCDPRTGYCVDCRDFTSGPKCDRCENAFYGDPRIGYDIPCRPCPCPGTAESGISHADTCELDPRTQNVVCFCETGYAGERCDQCSENYYGDPTRRGGDCRPCECSDNVDVTLPGNCDSRTGECSRCLYNTEGYYCERCKLGYYGNAKLQQCRECVCNILGTNETAGPCDGSTGQCHCLPNVVGLACDRCAPNHWRIASGVGCEPCACDSVGSYSPTCNEFDGQCSCRTGHGGRQCNECEGNYWGNPYEQCFQCQCNPEGSATLQCRRNNGTCVCLEGISGDHCDQCARGHTGNAPYCSPCGECFDNWDFIIQNLTEHTLVLIKMAREMKKMGVTGVYTVEFQEMENQLQEVREILASSNVTTADIEELQNEVNRIRENLDRSEQKLKRVEDEVEDTSQKIYDADLALADLKLRAKNLTYDVSVLKDNATTLKEADVEGAFNITKDAQKKSRAAEHTVSDTAPILRESERQRQLTTRLLDQSADRYNRTYANNELALDRIGNDINRLEEQIPDVNEMVCDGRGTVDTCDTLCGGAGCDKCGGLSCTKGAVTKAEDALELANKTTGELRNKERAAKDLLKDVEGAKEAANEALEEARLAFASAQSAKNQSENATSDLEDLLERIRNFLESPAAKPAEIRVIAQECLDLKISLRPEQIMDLARQINDTIESLTNIDAILNATGDNLALAKRLKDRADRAKANANDTLEMAKDVVDALRIAKDAQDKAQEAIDKAKSAIGDAEKDLTQIASETTAAQEVSNKSVSDVGDLQKRLDDLKKQFTRNELDAKKAAVEAGVAGKSADKAEKDAQELEKKYNEAIDKVEGWAKVSGSAKQRAEKLKERAKKLAEEANSKMKELQEMEDEFDDNEKKLKDYSDILDRLNMEMMGHLNFIEEKSTFYRDCQSTG